MPILYFVFTLVAVALVFDFFNGFHDAANSVATVVTTRVLSPLQAVLWAAFFNFIAAFFSAPESPRLSAINSSIPKLSMSMSSAADLLAPSLGTSSHG
jgi:phosphate/sulfate permease